jgi:hypothetical protein
MWAFLADPRLSKGEKGGVGLGICFLMGKILSYGENLLNPEKGLCLWR